MSMENSPIASPKRRQAARDPDNQKYLRPADEVVQEFFNRYDLDKSGTMNSTEELRQLATNLIVKCSIRIQPASINEKVSKIGDDVDWDIEQFKDWFYDAFEFSNKGMDDALQSMLLSPPTSPTSSSQPAASGQLSSGESPGSVGVSGASSAAPACADEDSHHCLFGNRPLWACVTIGCILVGGILLAIAAAVDKPAALVIFGMLFLIAAVVLVTAVFYVKFPALDVQTSHGFRPLSDVVVHSPNSGQLVPRGCTDYVVDNQGQPLKCASERGVFRCAGECHLQFGFQLTNAPNGPSEQRGHLLCLQEFEATGSEIFVIFEYNMCGSEGAEDAGEGFCAYLLDPSVAGWDDKFDGGGSMGFVDKAGAIMGVGFDLTGTFSEDPEKKNHITIKSAQKSADGIVATHKVDGSLATGVDEWRRVAIRFNLNNNSCDVIYNGKPVIRGASMQGIRLPKDLCVAVCGAAHDPTYMIAINELHLSDIEDIKTPRMPRKSELNPPDSNCIPDGCIDYGVDKNGELAKQDTAGDWRLAGNDVKVGFGFELVQDKPNQEGHLLCRVPFEASSNEIHASLEYCMGPSVQGGEGLCVYLVDPSVEGWDQHFDGSGPMGFMGKKGAIVGVGVDQTGSFAGKPNHVAIKRASDGEMLGEAVALDHDAVTPQDEWRKIKIKFDIEENKCDVKVGGKKVLDDVHFTGVKIPKKVCIAVCAATTDKHFTVCVNNVLLESEDNDHQEGLQVECEAEVEAEIITNEIEATKPVVWETAIPAGCLDYSPDNEGEMALQTEPADWRLAGTEVTCGFGFELCQDKPNQEGHLLCRVPFEASGSEIFASLDYCMGPSEDGGEGLCVYLVDPSVEGWDQHFDGSDTLGFIGKKGAIVGVGIDQTGSFAGKPNHVAIKRASDGEMLGEAVALDHDAVTPEDDWRHIKIKFDIQDNTCDVTIDNKKVLDDVHFTGVKIPKQVCIGVCAATSDKHFAICVNEVLLEDVDGQDAEIDL